MAMILSSRSKAYENIVFSASQPSDSSTILQIAGIAARTRIRGWSHFTLAGAPEDMEAHRLRTAQLSDGFPLSREWKRTPGRQRAPPAVALTSNSGSTFHIALI